MTAIDLQTGEAIPLVRDKHSHNEYIEFLKLLDDEVVFLKMLDGKVAVITGAGKGIGQAIAIAFAEQGIRVCCIARTLSEIEFTVEQIRKAGGNAIPVSCDVTNYDEMKEAMRKVFEHYGQIDIVVINAGTDCKKMPVDKLDIEEWKRVMDVNLNGAFFTAKAAIPYLKRNGSGKIIMVGSGMGHKGRADSSAYSCSKAGLWMLTRILAQELSEYKISVNEMIPGPVNTDIANYSVNNERVASSLGDEWFKNPSDVTDLAVFLAGQPDIGPTAQSYSLMRRDI